MKSATWFSQYLSLNEQGASLSAQQLPHARLSQQSVSTYSKRRKKVTNLLEQKLIKQQGAREVILSNTTEQARAILFHYLTTRGNNILNLNSSILSLENDKWENKGIFIRHIKSYDAAEIEKNIDDKTSLIYLETINHHTLDVVSLLRIYVIAKQHKIPVIADNSKGYLGTLIKPINYGINFSIDEASLLWGNHQEEFTAVISEGQPFEWNKNKHPRLTDSYKKLKEKHPEKKQKDFSFLEIVLAEENEEAKEISAELSAVVHEKTHQLQQQVREYSSHTLQIAEYLYQLQFIRFVHYAGLKSSKNHFSALTYLRNGFGNELAFETDSSELDRAVQEIFNKSGQQSFSYRYNPNNQWHHLKLQGAQAHHILQLFHKVSEKWVEHSKKSGLLPWNLDYSI